MESLVNVSKAPLDDVETLSESHDDVETAAAKSPHDDDAEEDLEEKDAKSARAKL